MREGREGERERGGMFGEGEEGKEERRDGVWGGRGMVFGEGEEVRERGGMFWGERDGVWR